MLTPHPSMSDELFGDVIDYNVEGEGNQDELMVRYWDEVSEKVLKLADKYGLEPIYVITEFCIDSDFPTEPNEL